MYQFEVSLRRNLEKQIWVPWFEGYSYARSEEYPYLGKMNEGHKVSIKLEKATAEEINSLGAELLGPKSRQLLVA